MDHTSDKERELKLLLRNIAGADAEQLYKRLIPVATVDALLDFLRDVTLPTQAEVVTEWAHGMLDAVGGDGITDQLSAQLHYYQTGEDARITFDAKIGSLFESLKSCLEEGTTVEGVTKEGENRRVVGDRLEPIAWSGPLHCDFCSGVLKAGTSVRYCPIVIRVITVEGSVGNDEGYMICPDCEKVIRERSSMTFGEYALIVARAAMVGRE